MRRFPTPPLALLCLALLGTVPAGAAPVVADDAVAVIAWEPSAADGEPPEALREALAVLPWSAARQTAGDLLAHLAAGDEATPVRSIARVLRALLTEAAPMAGMFTACPALAAALDGTGIPLPDRGFALTAGAPERPAWLAALGGLSLVARFDAAGAAQLDRLLAALADCEAVRGEPLAADAPGLELTRFRLAGIFSLALGRAGDTLVLSPDPERARALLERATDGAGALLPPLESGPAGGLRLRLDFAAVAAVLGADTTGAPAPEVTARILAALRTLGRYDLAFAVTRHGLLGRSRLAVDAQGGDTALRDLLLCRDCAVDAGVAAPAGAVQVTSRHLDLAGWVDYADEWVRLASGGRQGLRGWLAREHGLDLDQALLAWLGTESHRVLLAPLDSRLGSLLWLPPQALVLPVRDAGAARAGLAAIAEAAGAMPLERLMAGATGEPFDLPGAGSWTQQTRRYRGVEVVETYAGPLASFAHAIARDRLILATPAHAMNRMLDATLDGERPMRLARGPGMPAGAYALSRQDSAAVFSGLQELLAVMAQPAAYFTAQWLRAGPGGPGGGQSAQGQATVGPLAGTLTLPEGGSSVSVDGHLGATTPAPRDFRLEGLEPGTPVTVSLTSDAFDTYLSLIDVAAGGIIRENDDAPDTRRSAITFRPRAGTTYWVRVGSYADGGSGPYRLRAVPAAPAAEPPPPAGPALDVSAGPDSLAGELTPAARPLRYRIEGIPGRREVSVALASNAFDTYLYLVDPVLGAVLAENDDAPDTTRSALSFIAEPGREYWVQVDSYQSAEGGPFTLSASTGPAGSAVPEVIQPVDTTGIEPRALIVAGDAVSGRLGLPEGASVHHDFALDGLDAGDLLQVDLEATAFDTYLYLVDAASGAFLMENDDHAGSLDRSRLVFEALPGREYVLRAASFGGEGTGPYRLRVTRVAAADDGSAVAERPEPPGFGALLTLYGLLPRTAEVLAGHVGEGGSYGVVRGDTVIGESLVPWRGR